MAQQKHMHMQQMTVSSVLTQSQEMLQSHVGLHIQSPLQLFPVTVSLSIEHSPRTSSFFWEEHTLFGQYIFCEYAVTLFLIKIFHKTEISYYVQREKGLYFDLTSL